MSYVSRPSSELDLDRTIRETITVIEEDRDPIDTGLFDHTGGRIYRIRDTVPMGYRPR